MFTQSVENIVEAAVSKRDKMNESLPRYFLAA
ncbi:MAG TPA: nitrite transporter NirC, partial [Paenibacillus sp.]|nr:nitrite transporter NirC [Paenibacillus sp.]